MTVATKPNFTRNLFCAVLALTLIFRFWLAATQPLQGDEAEFFYWGVFLDYGYYDHPPMIGWILHALMQVSRSEWVLRLPLVLLPAAMALAIVMLFRRDHGDRAWLAATLLLVAPVNVWNVMITTDTPLIAFAFISTLFFVRAARKDSMVLYAWSGLFLGLAFLSKYFAVLQGLAYLAFVLSEPRVTGKILRRWQGLLIVFVAVLPAALLNIWWNYTHCWANILFNLYNRNDDAVWSLKTPLIYAVMMLYLITPPMLWYAWRQRETVVNQWHNVEFRAYAITLVAPLVLFALLSGTKTIGLHWVLAFYSLLFIVAMFAFTERQLLGSVKFMSAFSLLHVLLIIAVWATPLEFWKSAQVPKAISKNYDGIVYTFKPKEIIEALRPYEKDYIAGADGYSLAYVLSYTANHYFFTFGEKTSHGRQDDIDTDFRKLDGKNLMIVRKSTPVMGDYTPFFKNIEVKQFDVRGQPFWVILGDTFSYPAYRGRVLTAIRSKYYRIPHFLPTAACYFCDQYFPGEPYLIPAN